MTILQKASAGGGEGWDFVLSDETPDLSGDIVMSSGWALSRFRENPVALWEHGRDPELGRTPIGKWDNLRIVGKQLRGTLVPAWGVLPRIDAILTLIQRGFLRAVSVGVAVLLAEPVDPKRMVRGTRIQKQELLECSVCAVPMNPAALSLAKSLKLSDETMSLAFGEQATSVRRDVSATGEHAVTTPNEIRSKAGLPSITKVKPMTTLAERIVDAQNALVAKKDKLTELTAADAPDVVAIEELTSQIDIEERSVAALKAAEQKIGISAAPAGGGAPQAPAVNRRPLGFPQKDVEPLDLLVRALTVQGISAFGAGNKSIDKVLDERYPGHEATAIVAKADQTIGTTGVSGWASELVQTVNSGFLQALTGMSVYPALRSKGVGLSFDGIGTIKLPRRTAGGAGGGFVAEGDPIRVGRITTAAAELTPKKLGVIVPFSRELAKRSTPAIEAIVRQAILEDTAAILDSAILDATAASGARPAGLLNGVAAVASGYGGEDHVAVKKDFAALLAPFISANAADNITVIMNPAQALSIAMMDGPDNNSGWFSGISSRVNIVESTHATAGRLIAIRNSDFYTAVGDAPEFDINETATVHMEDTTPLPLHDGSTPADPVRSFYQTATVGVRMLMDVSWVMGRPSMVQWIDGTQY